MDAVRTLYVGFDGEKVDSSAETLKQIDELKKLECALESQGEKREWKDFDNPEEPRTLFQFIVGDRKMRVDQDIAMADRPPIAVVTAVGDKAVRLEFYEGHDALKLTYDLRARELQNKDIPRWMEVDPQAYNPYRFLKEIGFPVPEGLIEAVDKEQEKT